MKLAPSREEISERWENYRKANSDKPSARENELREVFSLVRASEGQKILEVGTGNGYLTLPLAQAVGDTGEVVTTDVNEGNISDIQNKNKANITAILLPPSQGALNEAKYEGYFDIVASIATLHHFDNRADGTGDTGRREAIKQFYKNLKNGGRAVVADVLDGTISQKYFDAIDNPVHCSPSGHPHDFFDKDDLKKAFEEAGFKSIKIEVKLVPWRFTSEEEAKNFIHTIHNAKCSAEESIAVAEQHLGLKKVEDRYELGWELFFLEAVK